MLQRRFDLAMRGLFPKGAPKAALVAVSGGVDSMVLFDLLKAYYASRPGQTLTAVYLDHGQRADTHRDVQAIEAYCQLHQVPLVTRKLGVPPGASEQQLRQARYHALHELAKDQTVVFTAHHADDDLETYLLKLIRGTHPHSLRGIPARSRRQGLRLARPLLPFTKTELIQHAKSCGLNWHEDNTNQSSRYARNRVRHEVLPLFEELRPGSSRRLLKFFRALSKSAPAAVSPKKIHAASTQLRSPQGVDIRQVDFHFLKSAIDQLLGPLSARTTQAHWQNLQNQLSQRQQTRHGGGEQKTLQFPGGYALCFKGNRVFWIR